MKGDIQSSLLFLTEYLEQNGDKYNKLYSNLRGYRLSEETANAISLLISHAYQSVLTNQRKRQTGTINKAKVQSITTAMQSFMLSNSGEVAIPITLKGKIQTIFDNLKGANGADLYENYTNNVEGNKLSTNKQPFDVQDMRNRSGVVVQAEAVHTFTFFVSAQYKKGIMLDTGTLKELGKESNRPLVNLVEAEIRKDPTTTYLQLEVNKINSRLERLNSIAPSAGIALSGGLVFLQTRAMFTNLEAMGRDVSLSKNMESGSAAIGASLMVMSASIELAANLTQLRAVTKELQIKAAQRSLLAATIGMWAGWAEVGYLFIYKFNRESVPMGYIASNMISVATFSFAGRALAEVMAKRTGARLSVSIVFSQVGGIALFANPYFLVGVMVIGLGVSLWSYFKMSVYDKSTDNLNNIDYWLDFGVFGKREFLTDKYSDRNSYVDPDSNKVVSSFRSAASEVAALAIDMRKNDIKIIIKNSITSECDITVEITSYLPISEKDTISYKLTTFYTPKELQPYSNADVSSYFKDKVTINDSVPLNKILKLETRDDVFARIGQTSRTNQNIKVELPKGLSSYMYTQTEGGYKLLLKFVIHEPSFEFARVDFSLSNAAYDKESGTTYTQKRSKSKTVEEKPYVLMRDR